MMRLKRGGSQKKREKRKKIIEQRLRIQNRNRGLRIEDARAGKGKKENRSKMGR